MFWPIVGRSKSLVVAFQCLLLLHRLLLISGKSNQMLCQRVECISPNDHRVRAATKSTTSLPGVRLNKRTRTGVFHATTTAALYRPGWASEALPSWSWARSLVLLHCRVNGVVYCCVVLYGVFTCAMYVVFFAHASFPPPCLAVTPDGAPFSRRMARTPHPRSPSTNARACGRAMTAQRCLRRHRHHHPYLSCPLRSRTAPQSTATAATAVAARGGNT